MPWKGVGVIFVLALTIGASVLKVYAYKVPTHQKITQLSYTNSRNIGFFLRTFALSKKTYNDFFISLAMEKFIATNEAVCIHGTNPKRLRS